MAKIKIELPRIYTRDKWAENKIPEHKKYIGKQYISWSQIESYNDKSGFNTGFDGDLEYILSYFSGFTFPDMGWGDFGTQVENYITERKDGDKFSDEEKEVLEKITPLGVYQKEICLYIEELDVIVLGFIDDMSPIIESTVKIVRDYKTKSESSKKDLHLDKKHQLEIYVLYLKQQGVTVKNAEYCIIERLGGYQCMQGGGRDVLKVGKRIWYEPYNKALDEKRLIQTKKLLISTIKDISETYKIYNKFFVD